MTNDRPTTFFACSLAGATCVDSAISACVCDTGYHLIENCQSSKVSDAIRAGRERTTTIENFMYGWIFVKFEIYQRETCTNDRTASLYQRGDFNMTIFAT